jgi:hypothetical protein
VGRISNRIEVSARPDRSQAGHQSQEHKLHRVECNISTTCGEGNLSVDTQALKGICDHVSSEPQAERIDHHQR